MKYLVVCAALAAGFNLQRTKLHKSRFNATQPYYNATQPLGPASINNYPAFAKGMAESLTCAALESRVTHMCGILQFWELIPQFSGSLTNCNSVVQSNLSVRRLMEDSLGAGANCWTPVLAFSTWVDDDGVQKYTTQQQCMLDIRINDFDKYCTIAQIPATPAPMVIDEVVDVNVDVTNANTLTPGQVAMIDAAAAPAPAA